jgi:hypothetical protein
MCTTCCTLAHCCVRSYNCLTLPNRLVVITIACCVLFSQLAPQRGCLQPKLAKQANCEHQHLLCIFLTSRTPENTQPKLAKQAYCHHHHLLCVYLTSLSLGVARSSG